MKVLPKDLLHNYFPSIDRLSEIFPLKDNEVSSSF
jgi:hypothetical protein